MSQRLGQGKIRSIKLSTLSKIRNIASEKTLSYREATLLLKRYENGKAIIYKSRSVGMSTALEGLYESARKCRAAGEELREGWLAVIDSNNRKPRGQRKFT